MLLQYTSWTKSSEEMQECPQNPETRSQGPIHIIKFNAYNSNRHKQFSMLFTARQQDYKTQPNTLSSQSRLLQ